MNRYLYFMLNVPDKINNFIGGIYLPPATNKYIENINPATGKVFSLIAESDDRDVELAVKKAKAAFTDWSNSSVERRFSILNKLAELIDEHSEELALAETTDNGNPLWLSKKVDIPRAAANFRFFATGIMHFAQESHAMGKHIINYTLRQPLGIVGCISPWNLPLYLFTWKIAPALAAGNCVIAKPSEVTPLTASMLGDLSIKAGLPPGVLNILQGTGESCGKAIVSHPEIKAISFTGSTRAGKEISAIAAPLFKKISLELGGKNPNIIFADCNWDKLMKVTLQSSFSNQGQICLCGSRILVEEGIYEKFKKEFVEKTKLLSVGDPMQDKSKQGAIVSEIHFNKILKAIATAKEEGGKILCGGEKVSLKGRCEKGYFIQPTIIEGLGPECKSNREEIFGPVVTLQSFKNEEAALQLANDCEYGLSATVWTQDVSRAHRIAGNLHAGIIWINCWLLRDLRTPFGGMKNSGVGREGGWEALRFFTEAKNVCIEV
ncbi:MAG: aldehyde dehydrogenase [Ginsengibacter sp.]